MEFGWAIYSGFRKCAQFRGRERPLEYSLWISFVILAAALLGALDAFFAFDSQIVLFWLLAILGPTVAMTVRRLHDLNRSGWWTLALLAPVVGQVIFFGFLFKPGDPAPNRFGAGGSARPA